MFLFRSDKNSGCWGKTKLTIDILFCLNGDIWIFYRHFYWVILYVPYAFVLSAEFDWLLGRQKGLIFVKMLKSILLRNRNVDKADTLNTCL